MPARKTTTAPAGQSLDDAAAQDAEFEEIEGAELDSEAAIQNWLADLGGADDAKIMVYRMDAKTKKPVYIEAFTPAEMDGGDLMHKLRHEYGGGTFRIQMRADGKIRKSQHVDIEPPPKRDTSNGPLGNQDLAALVRELRGEQRGDNSAELLMAMMQQQAQQADRNMQMMIAAMQNSQQREPGPSMTELVSSLAALKQLSGDDDQKEKPMDMLLKGIELAKELNGGGGETNMFDVLTKSLGAFGGTIQQAMAAQPQQPQQTQAQQLPAPQQPANQQPQTGANPAPQQTAPQPLPDAHPLKQYEPFINMLVGAAAKDADPFVYANVVVDQMGEEQAGAIFTNPQIVAQLIQSMPQLQPHIEWLSEMADEIGGILLGEEGEEGAGVDDDATAGDTPGHVDQHEPSAHAGGTGNGREQPAPLLSVGNADRGAGHPADVAGDGDVDEPGESGTAD